MLHVALLKVKIENSEVSYGPILTSQLFTTAFKLQKPVPDRLVWITKELFFSIFFFHVIHFQISYSMQFWIKSPNFRNSHSCGVVIHAPTILAKITWDTKDEFTRVTRCLQIPKFFHPPSPLSNVERSTPIHCLFTESEIKIELGEGDLK